MNSRYGRFNINDFILYIIIYGLMLLGGLIALVSTDLKWASILLMTVSIGCVIKMLLPYREKFSIHSDKIIVRVGRREQTISLPKRLTIVISLTDIRETMGNQSYVLNGKYSLTLLENLSAEEFIQRYRATKATKYTTSVLEEKFKHHYIYSFVYDCSVMKQLLAGCECIFIVPKSIADIISDDIDDTIHLTVDTQY